jgi:hypothetical protein
VIDADEVMERVGAVQEENLKGLDDDVDILKAYLKTQHSPKATIEALITSRKAVDTTAISHPCFMEVQLRSKRPTRLPG